MKKNLEIYDKAIKMIDSCKSEEHLVSASKYLDQIGLTDMELSRALRYSLHSKTKKIKELKTDINEINVEYEVVTK